MRELGERFHEHGLAARSMAAGCGRKPTDTSAHQARLLQEGQRTPDRKADQTATWSLSLLRKALQATELPQIANEPIRQMLHTSRPVSADTHLVPHGRRTAHTHKRHGDDL